MFLSYTLKKGVVKSNEKIRLCRILQSKYSGTSSKTISKILAVQQNYLKNCCCLFTACNYYWNVYPEFSRQMEICLWLESAGTFIRIWHDTEAKLCWDGGALSWACCHVSGSHKNSCHFWAFICVLPKILCRDTKQYVQSVILLYTLSHTYLEVVRSWTSHLPNVKRLNLSDLQSKVLICTFSHASNHQPIITCCLLRCKWK